MKAKEHIKFIEARDSDPLITDDYFMAREDRRWLINRVKKLTEHLGLVLSLYQDDFDSSDGDGPEILDNAREALESE